MARRDEDKSLVYQVPQNFKEGGVTGNGISYRRLVEGGILSAFAIFLAWVLPIPFAPKIVTGASLTILSMFLAVKGVNNCTLSEYLLGFIRFRLRPNLYVRRELYTEEDKETES